MFAGSIFDLEPDTEYECRFIMSDPGISGKNDKLVSVRTRAEPMPFEGGRTLHVYPYGYKGPREELCSATGQECNGILVDYDIFQNVGQADLSDFTKIYKTEELDFQLKPIAVAVDKGCILPNINDGFTGQAPDLGALEVGRSMPHCGPRP
jgi:hypothetical protein